jgi:elongator complex protein 3
VNRVIRDIPSTNVVEGNKRTSLRQDIQLELKRRGDRCECIRCREVRADVVDPVELNLNDLVYDTGGSEEHFITYNTPDDRLAGFLRLSLPNRGAPKHELQDLLGAAIVREVHVYGQSLEVGEDALGVTQHSGLGTRLMLEAERVAIHHGFSTLAVIAALGTRGYYRKLGYSLGESYMVKTLEA